MSTLDETQLFKYEKLINIAQVGVWEWDVKNKTITINKALAAKLGYTNKPSVTMSLAAWLDLTHKDDLNITKTAVNKILMKGKAPFSFASRKRDKNGAYIWFKHEGGVIKRDDEGRPLVLMGLSIDADEVKSLEIALKKKERSEAALIANLPGITYRCLYDPQWTMLFISDGCYKITGYKPEELINNKQRSFNDLIHEEDRKKVRSIVDKAFNEQKSLEVEYRIVAKNGLVKWVWEQGTAVHYEDENQTYLEGIILDITDRVMLTRQLGMERQRLSRVVESTTDFIFEINTDCEFVSVYGQGLQKLGIESDAFIGKTVENVFGKEGKRCQRFFKSAINGDDTRFEWNFVRDGETLHFAVSLSPISDYKKNVIGAVGISREITEEKDRQFQIEQLSYRDQLTGLYNRYYLMETAEREMHRAARYQQPLSMIVIDIDNFKKINDQHGHTEGDRVLKSVAESMLNTLRLSDFAFRAGGDEFMILLPQTSATSAFHLSERLNTCFQEIPLENVQIHCSFGVAEYDNKKSLTSWWQTADKAMYQSKSSHKKITIS